MSPPNARRRPGTNRTADVVRHGGRGDDVTVTEPMMFARQRNAYGVGWTLDPASIARNDAIETIEKTSDDWSRRTIDQAIKAVGETQGHVTANDVRELLPQVRPALIGSRFLAAAKRGDLQEDGMARANHAAGHARRIVRWRWVG